MERQNAATSPNVVHRVIATGGDPGEILRLRAQIQAGPVAEIAAVRDAFVGTESRLAEHDDGVVAWVFRRTEPCQAALEAISAEFPSLDFDVLIMLDRSSHMTTSALISEGEPIVGWQTSSARKKDGARSG